MLSLQLVTLVPTGYWMFIHFLIFIFWPNLSLIKTMLQTCGEMVPTYLLFTGKELESVNHADIRNFCYNIVKSQVIIKKIL